MLHLPELRGRAENLVRKRGKGTDLEVFSDRAGRANAAIFEVLAKESPQTIKQILKKIIKYEGLQETYYASLTKRLRNLREIGLIEEIKPNQKGAPASYRLCPRRSSQWFSRKIVCKKSLIRQQISRQVTFCWQC